MSETSRLTEEILRTAREKAKQIVTEAEAENEAALDEARVHFSREAENMLRNARAEAEAIKRRRLSETARRLKLLEQQEKGKIVADVLNETRKHVVEVLNDENRYIPFFLGLMTDGIRELGLDDVVLHVNADDIKKLDRNKLEDKVTKTLGRKVKIRWSEEPIQASGGVTVSSADGRIRIVNTLDERFNALESKLLVEAGKLLFRS